MLTPLKFKRSFNRLILIAWLVPALFGLSFIGFIEVLTVEQLMGILRTPSEPAFVLLWLIFAHVYFRQFINPVVQYLEYPDSDNAQQALLCMRRFSWWFWFWFLLYLVSAPTSVILSAEYFTDYVAQPVDWFRLHLVALIVSIIVGLPIFFSVLDLFGRALGEMEFSTPHITVKAKVFLIGALVPLLIDTMIVQYYWTRTGFFTLETFWVWLFLELIAVAGSLIFMRSFAQSLSPLQQLVAQSDLVQYPSAELKPRSTDEIGVLTNSFRRAINDLQIYSEILEVSNQLLRQTGNADGIQNVSSVIIQLSRHAMSADRAYLLLCDHENNHLNCVASNEHDFDSRGHFTISLSDHSLVTSAFLQGQTVAVSDQQQDPTCCPELGENLDIQSAIASPFLIDGKKAGVLLAVNDTQPKHYSRREKRLMQGLAREAAIAIQTQNLKLEHAQAVEARTERDELINLLMQSTEQGIYGVDTQGLCTFINDTALDMLGYSSDQELIGQSIHELIHHTYPDGRHYPKQDCAVRLAIVNDAPAHADDEVHWRKDGSSFPVEYWSRPLHKNGEILGAVVTFVDISQRLQTQNELEQSKQRLELAVSAGDIGIWEWDIVRNHVEWSSKAEKIFALEPGGFKGDLAQFNEMVFPEDREAVASAITVSVEQHTPFIVEHRIVRADGELRWIYSQGKVLYQDDGTPELMIGTTVDITDRKLAEQELRLHQENLQELVDQRTQELTRLNQELEAFSYSVSHDLRTPLRAIDGFSHVLMEDYADVLDEQGLGYLRRVRRASQTMAELIDDMLQLSRISRSELKAQRINLSQLAQKAIEGLQQADPLRKVEIHIEEGLSCNADKKLMKVVLDNLIGNAWKYTSKMEHAKITFGQRQIDGKTVFFVEDNGAGFDMRYADKLFGVFQRLHKAEEFGGTGVGLATVHRILQRHSGKIWADAEVGKGATFFFSL